MKALKPLKAKYRDPVTGDPLTRSEMVSWYAQAIIRRWAFIVGYSLLTFGVWLFGTTMAVQWWNYSASWLALVIESVVGIAMFGQVRRDALILRELREMARKHEELSELVYEFLQRSEK